MVLALAGPTEVATTAPHAAASSASQVALSPGAQYVVRPGDSLWLIARRLLPGGASNAEIARMVNRIWTLNVRRIHTGDPNLLQVGTVLVLPA